MLSFSVGIYLSFCLSASKAFSCHVYWCFKWA